MDPRPGTLAALQAELDEEQRNFKRAKARVEQLEQELLDVTCSAVATVCEKAKKAVLRAYEAFGEPPPEELVFEFRRHTLAVDIVAVWKLPYTEPASALVYTEYKQRFIAQLSELHHHVAKATAAAVERNRMEYRLERLHYLANEEETPHEDNTDNTRDNTETSS